MTSPSAKPTTISLPMKPRDRAAACPQETRCQLEVIWNDGHGALTILDGPKDSKVVQIGLIGEKGCDARVRVGMIEAGGIFAVGSSLVGESGQLWERRLGDCLDPSSLFWKEPPHSLLNIRYTNDDLVAVLSVASLASGDSWQVDVVRRVGRGSAPPFRRNFAYSDNSLVVSAALSDTLDQLFIVESKLDGSSYVATYHYYDINPYTGEWQWLRSGSVPRPGEAVSARPYYVDRQGNVGGYWSAEYTIADSVYNDDGTCNYQIASPGEYRSQSTVTMGEVHGGVWSILTRSYTEGVKRRRGVAVANSDLATIEESLRWSTGHIYQSYSYGWSASNDTPTHFVFTRTESSSHETGYEFDAAVGAVSLGRVNDAGISEYFSGQYVADVEVVSTYEECPIVGYGWFGELTMAVSGHRYVEGSVDLSVTPGGWIIRHEAAEILQAPNLDPETTELANCGNWTLGCPSPATAFASRVVEWAINTTELIHPVAAGAVGSIGRSFTAVDADSGTVYAGVYAQVVADGDFFWRIYRNGQNISNGVEECIGRPLDDLSALYWRP